MTVEEFWESEERLAIHCRTEKQANLLLKKFDELGQRWYAGDSYLEHSYWNRCGEKTCYNNEHGYFDLDYDYIRDEGVKVIEFTDLEEFKGQQEKIKQDALCCLKAMVEKENSQCARDTLEYFERLIEITDIIKKNISTV